MKFNVREAKEYTVVSFETGGVIEPSILRELKPPKVNAKRGVIPTGRGPIWLYGFLVHFYHPTAWVATYDPRHGGAIVVESHIASVKPGDVITLEDAEVD